MPENQDARSDNALDRFPWSQVAQGPLPPLPLFVLVQENNRRSGTSTVGWPMSPLKSRISELFRLSGKRFSRRSIAARTLLISEPVSTTYFQLKLGHSNAQRSENCRRLQRARDRGHPGFNIKVGGGCFCEIDAGYYFLKTRNWCF